MENEEATSGFPKFPGLLERKYPLGVFPSLPQSALGSGGAQGPPSVGRNQSEPEEERRKHPLCGDKLCGRLCVGTLRGR